MTRAAAWPGPALVAKMKENAKLWTALEKFKAGAAAVVQGVPISPLDPYGNIIDEAIRRAEKKMGT